MTKGQRLAIAGLVVIGVGLAAVAAVYLAGFFYLAASKTNPTTVTYLTWYQYWFHYNDIPPLRKRLILSAALAGGVCFFAPLIAFAAATSKKRELHGSARFANNKEVEKSGLFADSGILVGKFRDRYLTFPGQQFVLLAAPTRSGKGVGVVIPNLLNYNDSVVVLDVKQENYDITSGFRAKYGQKIYLFNPLAEDMRSHRYNPLGYISDNPHFRNGDVLAIGYAFWTGEGKDPFFDDQARNLFLGLCLCLCETPRLPRTMGELLRQSSGKGMPVKEYLLSIIDKRNFQDAIQEVDVVDKKTGMPKFDPATGEIMRETIKVRVPIDVWDGKGEPPLSEDCVDALNRFTSTSDNTLSSILASFNAPLGIWANPIVDAATSANDFDLRDVRKVKMTIYVGITPDHLVEAGRLVNVLFSQLVNLNTKELPQKNPALKHQCLLLMDEFTAIGKVPIIAKAVSYMAGYNLRLLPIIQSLSQLTSVYGQEDARTFVTNHALQIMYAPREQKDANEYSEMLGYETVRGKSKSKNFGGGRAGGRSESESDQRRALLLPQELKEIGLWKEIINLENTKPILCEKIKYFEDPVFMSRLLPAPAVPLLDLDLHIAIIQARTRELTVADVESGVDLSKLQLDIAAFAAIGSAEAPSPEAVKGVVSDFFAQLGVDMGDEEDEVGAPSELQVVGGDDEAGGEILRGDDDVESPAPVLASVDTISSSGTTAVAVVEDPGDDQEEPYDDGYGDDAPPADGLVDLGVLEDRA